MTPPSAACRIAKLFTGPILKTARQKYESKLIADVELRKILSAVEGLTSGQVANLMVMKGSADIRFGKILSVLEEMRTDSTLAKYFLEATGIGSRDIGHAYKARIVYDSLVRSRLIPEAVYDSALPSWIVPTCVIVKELEKQQHAHQKQAVLAELAALFSAGQKGDDTTTKINAIKERVTGKPVKTVTKNKKALAQALADAEARLKAAEEKLAQGRARDD